MGFFDNGIPGLNQLPGGNGGLFGLPGVGGNLDPLQKSMAGSAGYNPAQPAYDPTRADVERGQGNDVRGQQGEYNAWLQNAAMGKGPSVAQSQLSQGRDKAISAAASQAAAARGGNAALANRSAVQTAGNMGMQANRDAAALRAQEQMGYANQWGQGLQAQRAGDQLGRGQSIDEQKAQLAAQTAYQQNQGQIAAGNAERQQGLLGDVLGGGPGALFNSDQSDQDRDRLARRGQVRHPGGEPRHASGDDGRPGGHAAGADELQPAVRRPEPGGSRHRRLRPGRCAEGGAGPDDPAGHHPGRGEHEERPRRRAHRQPHRWAAQSATRRPRRTCGARARRSTRWCPERPSA